MATTADYAASEAAAAKRREARAQRVLTAAVLLPCPLSQSELMSELISTERHIEALEQVRRTLQRQLADAT